MRVFVLGGSGFIGSAVVQELLAHGHEVTALARSERSAAALRQAGCTVVRGDIAAPENWIGALGAPDAVIHMADTFDDTMAAIDRRLLDGLLAHLAGRGRRPRFLYTGGCWLYGESEEITEDAPLDPLPDFAWMVGARERLLVSEAVEAIMIHPAMVYDLDVRQPGVFMGFVSEARAGGPVSVVGSESVRWPLVQRDDLAVLYRLTLEGGRPGADYHGVAEPGVTVGSIARAIARRFHAGEALRIRSVEEIVAELGSWARGYAHDQCMTGTAAREDLGWQPAHSDVLREIAGTWRGVAE